jgi:hypothetical protein
MTPAAADDVLDALLADLQELSTISDLRGTTPFVIRSYVRTLFSILEAWSYHTKHKAYASGTASGMQFSRKDIEMITERRERNGSSMIKSVPPGENVVYAARLWSRVFGSDDPPVQLPPEFERVRALRNRITHPKSRADLATTPQDASDTGNLLLWLQRLLTWQSRSEIQTIRRMRERIASDTNTLRNQIREHGDVEPFEGTIEELYTAPKLPRRDR